MRQIYSASGNTFIFLETLTVAPKVADLCQMNRVDGAIYLQPLNDTSFEMFFFNRDGSKSSLCGNGLRACKAHLDASDYPHKVANIITKSGLYQVKTCEKNQYALIYPSLKPIIDCLDVGDKEVFSINVGNPHIIYFTRDIDQIDVKQLGMFYRNHTAFGPEGTNVNFVKICSPTKGFIRTFERGVEDETGACGSGALASYLVSHHLGFSEAHFTFTTSSGEKLKHSRYHDQVKQVGNVNTLQSLAPIPLGKTD